MNCVYAIVNVIILTSKQTIRDSLLVETNNQSLIVSSVATTPHDIARKNTDPSHKSILPPRSDY